MAKKQKTAKSANANTANAAAPPAVPPGLIPPRGGAIVRMYRIGHGDCFLIAFSGEERPSYVLIDCGYKPKSPEKLTTPTDVGKIGADIIAATGGFIDVAIITHEHQDHVNGFRPANFPGLKVGKVWFAWTENPKDEIANQLRAKFNDRLLGLIDARVAFAAAGNDRIADDIDWYLEFELGEGAADYNGRQHAAAAAKDPAKSANKIAMQFLRQCATGEPEYLYPHERARPIPGAASARAFVLGPPRDVDKIDDLDPIGEESFGDDNGAPSMRADAPAAAGERTARLSPFQRRHVLPMEEALAHEDFGEFFRTYYGADKDGLAEVSDGEEVLTNAAWRRMSADDATEAGALALAMNNATNNASLVLAFELSKGGKVLLFVGDAQAGNWRSWADAAFDDGDKDRGDRHVTAKDLLARTVLYKVGHHCSHNATLKGKLDSKYPNLSWMAQGGNASEFIAMITSVEAWARQKPRPDWNHPMPQIKEALLEKAGGRVLQTDTSLDNIRPGARAAGWQSFLDRVKETPIYFELTIEA